MRVKYPTQNELKELFIYNSETGELIWNVNIKYHKLYGEVAGTKSGEYKYVKIKNKLLSLHRLVWIYNKGYDPENQIDHIDRNPHNNKIENLREVSQSCNKKNCGIQKSKIIIQGQ